MRTSGYADAYTLMIDAVELDALVDRCAPVCAAAPAPLRRRCAGAALRGHLCPCLAGAPEIADRLTAELDGRLMRAAPSAPESRRKEETWVA